MQKKEESRKLTVSIASATEISWALARTCRQKGQEVSGVWRLHWCHLHPGKPGSWDAFKKKKQLPCSITSPSHNITSVHWKTERAGEREKAEWPLLCISEPLAFFFVGVWDKTQRLSAQIKEGLTGLRVHTNTLRHVHWEAENTEPRARPAASALLNGAGMTRGRPGDNWCPWSWISSF